jgi:hypothetical protein
MLVNDFLVMTALLAMFAIVAIILRTMKVEIIKES